MSEHDEACEYQYGGEHRPLVCACNSRVDLQAEVARLTAKLAEVEAERDCYHNDCMAICDKLPDGIIDALDLPTAIHWRDEVRNIRQQLTRYCAALAEDQAPLVAAAVHQAFPLGIPIAEEIYTVVLADRRRVAGLVENP